MPVTSPATNLTEIFAHVWNRERSRVERATRISCLAVAREPGKRTLSKSDCENLMAVGHGEQPLDALNRDLRFPGEFWREYEAAVKEDWLKESRELKCSQVTPTSWVVACKVFGRWARKCVPGFHHDDQEVRINLQDHYRWLDTPSGAPYGQVQSAFVTLEETEIHEDLLRQLWEECAAESQEMGLPEPPTSSQPMTDGEKRFWDALYGRAVPGKALAKELDTSPDTVRGWKSRLVRSGYRVENRSGRGYFRPDAPPDDLSRE